MESPNTAPVLIRFKMLHLDQTDTVDYKAVKHKGTDKQGTAIRGDRRKIPLRSFSLSSVFATRGPLKKKSNREYKDKIEEAVLEFERFEKDFILPVLNREESCQSVKTKSSYQGLNNEISNISVKNKDKKFHSSTSSIQTETDSGAFSRLSSADSDSEFSDISIISNKDIKEISENSDLEIEEGLNLNLTYKKTSLLSPGPVMTNSSLHKSEHCKNTVTVNGVCYQCVLDCT